MEDVFEDCVRKAAAQERLSGGAFRCPVVAGRSPFLDGSDLCPRSTNVRRQIEELIRDDPELRWSSEGWNYPCRRSPMTAAAGGTAGIKQAVQFWTEPREESGGLGVERAVAFRQTRRV